MELDELGPTMVIIEPEDDDLVDYDTLLAEDYHRIRDEEVKKVRAAIQRDAEAKEKALEWHRNNR